MIASAPPVPAPSAPVAVVLSAAEPRRERVALTLDGRAWRDVSPPRIGAIDDVTFVDGRHGWVVSEDCAAGKGEVARTSDGGRTWRIAPFASHSCGAPSTFTLDFADARHGWIVELEGTASVAALWRTTDAGRSWHQVAHRLPGFGPILFHTAREGWLGGGDGLYRSESAGRTWRRLRAFSGRAFRAFAPPRFFGATGITAGVSKGAAAAWRTRDGGEHWKRTLLVPAQPSLFEPVALSAPGPSVCWLTVRGRRPQVYLTTDGGASWRDRGRVPSGAGKLQAVDARTAVAPAFRHKRAVVLVTHDGGHTWRPG